MTRTFRFALAAAAALTLAATGAYAEEHDHDDDHGHQHAGDIVIGIDGAGKLKAELPDHADLMPVSGLLNGFSNGSPGFQALADDEPTEDFYRLDLPGGATIWLDVISLDPALKLWLSGFTGVIDDPADPDARLTATGAEPELHYHGTWHIDATDPGYDPLADHYELTFRLVDTGSTGYAASDPYTIEFHAIPEPITATLLVAGSGLVALRRRRAG